VNGKVYGRQPQIEVPLVRENQRHLATEFVIDTGFDGFLMLPTTAVTALGLPFLYRLDANLADDRFVTAPRYTERLSCGQAYLLNNLLANGNIRESLAIRARQNYIAC
jgi:predicted aspartyl protease